MCQTFLPLSMLPRAVRFAPGAIPPPTALSGISMATAGLQWPDRGYSCWVRWSLSSQSRSVRNSSCLTASGYNSLALELQAIWRTLE